ncbi:DUF6493 family protein [Streptomyces sp. NPDC002054]|uniref:DUF6493 family protein n=1 Tax=Streptomyces sp. NPDC002054 TaxID=3154663 RepID=UPI003334A31B
MNAVLEAVRDGRTAEIPGLLKDLDRTQRRELLAELKELRREMRGWDWSRWQDRDVRGRALLIAGTGCHTGAAAAAAWIGARDLRTWQDLPYDTLLDLLSGRDPQWLGDLAHRLAGRTATARQDYPLISELVRLADCPAPLTDGYVEGWALAVGGPTHHRAGRGPSVPLAAALRRDPHVTDLVPRLFETAEPVAAFSWRFEPDNPEHWPAALAALAEDGTVDRATLIDGCTGRLLRGGKATDLKYYLVLLQRLNPTADEERERTADWLALASDAPSAVAGHAQQILARLAEAGQLDTGLLAEMSQAALFRPEKKLVRAQLVLLGRILRRERTAAAELLPVLAGVFGHPDTDIQERALKLAAAHLHGDEMLRAELADAAALLSPVHRTLAGELLGATAPAEDTEPYRETLPPRPVPARLAPSPDTVAETVELVAAVVNSRTATVAEFERALDGLVRRAHRDRTELAEALRPALADRWWLDGEPHAADRLTGLELVAAAVLDRAAPRTRRRNHHGASLPEFHKHCAHVALERVPVRRLREAAHRIGSAPLPFLLATPVWETGSIDPEELIRRLAAYHRLGITPAAADFAQALFRVRRDPAAAPAATALGTREGDRLAAWLGTEGAPPTLIRSTVVPRDHRFGYTFGNSGFDVPHLALDTGERPFAQPQFPEEFHALGRPRTGLISCWWRPSPADLAVLPEDRETLAAWLLPELAACAAGYDDRGAVEALARLAEAGGPAGQALHLAVATALGARYPEDRLAAVDALLTLAAREELDPVRLGTDLTELLTQGTVKPNRLADSLRTAAATGAYATTWAVLATALTAALDGSLQAAAAGELLEVAADCVEHCRVQGPEPAGLAATADRGGRTRLVTQAGRLRAALRSHPAPPAGS